ncbi:MAG: tryptophan--tRNA ligase [Anaerolineaceae bacterium]|nr:tryptophan--tRNA ligase [Anaerolineaceae bacterium]
METKGRILTGHRTTGARHIGHLVGTLQTWATLQDTYECFFLLADLHTLTTDYIHSEAVRENTIQVAADWLASGIDPERSTLLLQSALPQHVQLAMLFSMLVTVSRLERNPTFKEQVKELNLQPSLGLLTYPVLQAADILVYKADTVPVGEDQLPYLELAREIARRYNQLYHPIFPEPQALLSAMPRLPGTDNRTMHTSYRNQILISDTPEETSRKVMRMYTDPARIHPNDPGHVEGNPVFTYLDVFDPHPEGVAEMKRLYREGRIGDVAVKHHLVEVLNASLAPIRQRRIELMVHPERIVDIIRAGTDHARPIAQANLDEAMEDMGLTLVNAVSATNSGGSMLPLIGTFC